MRAGTGIADITPPLGIEMVGYYYKRNAEGIHDRLYAKTLFLDDGLTKAAVISCDLCYFEKSTILSIKSKISELNILPFENIIICATHTHTGPVIANDYEVYLVEKIAESLQKASVSTFEVKLSNTSAYVEGMCFNRRYIMKDGSVVTNPGKCNPDIVRPAGPAPTEIQIIRIDRIDKDEFALLINFALHPDTISGNLLSADYPCFIEKEIHEKLGNISEIIFTNGTSGNINHWDVKDSSPQRGFDEAERIGRTIRSKVISEFDKTVPVNGTRIKIGREKVMLPYVKVSKEDVAKAKKILEKPYPDGVDFTMEVVEAKKVISASELTDDFDEAEIVGIGMGDIAFIGIPAELFVELGMEIKEASPFKNTIIITLAQACVGYIATEKSYREGGYEVASNIHRQESGRIIVEGALRLLNSLKER